MTQNKNFADLLEAVEAQIPGNKTNPKSLLHKSFEEYRQRIASRHEAEGHKFAQTPNLIMPIDSYVNAMVSLAHLKCLLEVSPNFFGPEMRALVTMFDKLYENCRFSAEMPAHSGILETIEVKA